MSKLNDALAPIADTLQLVVQQLDKAKNEIIGALAGVEIPPDARAKIDALGGLATSLKSAAQAFDDLNQDAPAPPVNPGA